MRRDPIDFHAVRPEHLAIHDRLNNWAKWCRGSFANASMLPMFRDYRHGYEEPSPGADVDTLDGHRIEKVVVTLPEKHRTVLRWAYVKPWIPVLAVRRALGLRHPEVFDVLVDARSMMNNKVRRVGLDARAEIVSNLW